MRGKKLYYVVGKLMEIYGEEQNGTIAILPVFSDKKKAERFAGKQYKIFHIMPVDIRGK